MQGLDEQEERGRDQLDPQQVVKPEHVAVLPRIFIAGRVSYEHQEVDDVVGGQRPQQVHQHEEHQVGEQVRQRNRTYLRAGVSVVDA